MPSRECLYSASVTIPRGVSPSACACKQSHATRTAEAPADVQPSSAGARVEIAPNEAKRREMDSLRGTASGRRVLNHQRIGLYSQLPNPRLCTAQERAFP